MTRFAVNMQNPAEFKARRARLEAGIVAGELPSLESADYAAIMTLALEGRLEIPEVNTTPVWERSVRIAA